MATENPTTETTDEVTEPKRQKPIPQLVHSPMRRGTFDGTLGHLTPAGYDPMEMGQCIEWIFPDGRNAGFSQWVRDSELEAELKQIRGDGGQAEPEAPAPVSPN